MIYVCVYLCDGMHTCIYLHVCYHICVCVCACMNDALLLRLLRHNNLWGGYGRRRFVDPSIHVYSTPDTNLFSIFQLPDTRCMPGNVCPPRQGALFGLLAGIEVCVEGGRLGAGGRILSQIDASDSHLPTRVCSSVVKKEV